MAADRSEPTAIACTLGAGDFQRRLAWIADLNREALQSRHRHGLVLELTYASAALEKVEDMVARERECCAFLGFGVSVETDRVRLVIEAPADARDALDAVFEPFLSGAKPAAARDCPC